MEGYAYYNGGFGRRSEISVPLSDRAIFFGDAVYDAAVGSRGKIYQLGEHIERFLGNAARLGFSPAPTYEELEGILTEVAERSGLETFFLYFQISRSKDTRSHSAGGCAGTNLLVTADEVTLPSFEKKLKLILTEDKRYGYCDIKTVNLLPNVIYSTDADRSGADEAVLHRDGVVTECAHSNVSILKNGKLITHPADSNILPGITRKTLLSLCEELDVGYEERPFTKEELIFADEVLITSTSKFCLRAESVDGIAVGGKDPTAATLLCREMRLKYERFLAQIDK